MTYIGHEEEACQGSFNDERRTWVNDIPIDVGSSTQLFRESVDITVDE